MEQESHSRGKGNIPLSFPGCCLMESFPLPLLWGGTSSHFTPRGVFTFAKAEGSGGREFCHRGWRIGGLDAAEGNSGVTPQPWRLGTASFPQASGFELIHRAFQRFPGGLDPQKVGLSSGREESCTVLSPPGLCDTEDVGQ